MNAKHKVTLRGKIHNITPLDRGSHLTIIEEPGKKNVSAAMNWYELLEQFPELTLVPGLPENLVDDHINNNVRDWHHQIRYGDNLPGTSQQARELLSAASRLVLTEEWPGIPLRLRAANIARQWQHGQNVPAWAHDLSQQPHWNALMENIISRLMNGRNKELIETSQLPSQRLDPVFVELESPIRTGPIKLIETPLIIEADTTNQPQTGNTADAGHPLIKKDKQELHSHQTR